MSAAIAASGATDTRRPSAWAGASRAVRLTRLALLFATIGCADSRSADPAPEVSSADSSAVTVIDDAGREVRLARPARRVISLLPAGTETLFALGAGELVVAPHPLRHRSRHCPSSLRRGRPDPNLEAIVTLQPDLVIAFETAGGSRVRARLEALGIPVFADPNAGHGGRASQTCERFGELIGRSGSADSLAGAIRAELRDVGARRPGAPRPPWRTSIRRRSPHHRGDGHLHRRADRPRRGRATSAMPAAAVSPQVSLEELVRVQPDVVILPVGTDAHRVRGSAAPPPRLAGSGRGARRAGGSGAGGSDQPAGPAHSARPRGRSSRRCGRREQPR